MKLARKVFYSLEKSPFYKNWYIVLNDNNYVAGFYAASENEAIERFYNNDYKKED